MALSVNGIVEPLTAAEMLLMARASIEQESC